GCRDAAICQSYAARRGYRMAAVGNLQKAIGRVVDGAQWSRSLVGRYRKPTGSTDPWKSIWRQVHDHELSESESIHSPGFGQLRKHGHRHYRGARNFSIRLGALENIPRP